MSLHEFCDDPIYNCPRYYLAEEPEHMQVVPPEVKKCVVFIYYSDNVTERLAGTAFFVNRPIEETNRVAVYLVTAKHVIAQIKLRSKDQYVYIRINTADGKSRALRSKVSQWKYHPTDSSVDIAVLGVAPDPKEFDYLNLPIEMAATDGVIKDEAIGEGDEVFLTGLFSNNFGETKNLPIIRTGNIALMADEKVKTNSFGLIDAYLIEARSIGGLSGSPVFVYLGHSRAKNGEYNIGGQKKLFVWLGVMQGHWEIDETAIDGGIMEEAKHVNMGIGIVVPAIKVIEVIETQEDFVKERKEAQEKHKKAILPVEDSLNDVDISKEDFERTLKKVSKKVDSSDRDQPKEKK